MRGNIKTVGIVSALESEIALFKEILDNIEEKQIKKYKFTIGYIDGIKVVFTSSGIGKVNAAITTQILIDNFNPTIVINSGIAGGLDSRLKHTDLVVANELMYHDFDKRLLNSYFPFVENFKVEDKYLKLIRDILKGENYYEGLIITGDQFITSSEMQENLRNDFKGTCVEMEGTAIAHTAYVNDIPFIVIRCISDFADDDGENDYDDFEKVAAKKASELTIKLIRNL